MSKTLQIAISIALAILLVATGYIIGKVSQEEVPQTQTEAPVGTAGDTYSTAKISQIGMDVSSTTPCSLYNGDDRDRYIIKQYIYSEGLTTTEGAAISVTSATSTYADKNESNTNYAMNQAFPTTTDYMYISSTTPARTADNGDDVKFTWPASTYFNWYLTGLATSTASGVCGVEYISE